MSQENLEIVRLFFDAWNRRDEEALLALVDPEVEYRQLPDGNRAGNEARYERGSGRRQNTMGVPARWPDRDRSNLRSRGGGPRLGTRFPSDAGGPDPDRRSSP